MPRVAGPMEGDTDVEGDDGLGDDVDMECGLFRLDEQRAGLCETHDQDTKTSGATRVAGGLASSVSTTERSWDFGQGDPVPGSEEPTKNIEPSNREREYL